VTPDTIKPSPLSRVLDDHHRVSPVAKSGNMTMIPC